METAGENPAAESSEECARAVATSRSERLCERVQRTNSALLWLVMLLGVGLFTAGVWWSHQVAGRCGGLNLAVQLSGSDERLSWMLARCYAATPPLGRVGTVQLFFADFVVIVGYWLAGTLVLAAGWWRYEATALRRVSWVVWLPSFVAIADLVEDVLILLLIHNGPDGHLRVSSGDVLHTSGQWLLVSASSLKWILTGSTVIAVVMAGTVWLSRHNQHLRLAPAGAWEPETDQDKRTLQHSVAANRNGAIAEPSTEDPGRFADTRRRLDIPEVTDDEELMALNSLVVEAGATDDDGDSAAASGKETLMPRDDRPPKVGICVSGGGIRATTFALGVLTALEDTSVENDQPATTSARYLAAVSGGAWAATVWTLQKASYPKRSAAKAAIAGLTADAPDSGYQRQNYLLNRRGGVLPAVGYMLLCTASNLALIASLVYLVAWPLGTFLGACPISGTALGAQCGSADRLPQPLQLLHPAYLFVTGAVLFLFGYCGFGDKKRARRWPVGAALIGIAAFSAIYLVGLPRLFGYMHSRPDFVGLIGSFAGTSTIGVGIGGTLWKLFGGPLVHQITGRLGKAIPRLLGVVFGIAVAAWGLVAMYKAADGSWGWWTTLLALALTLLAYECTSPNCPTLHNIFADRLRRSFNPIANPFPPNPDDRTTTEESQPALKAATWQDLGAVSKPKPDATVPELILCCSQQRNGIAAGGLRAETFTISPHWTRQGRRSLRTERYLEAAKVVKRCRRPEFGDIDDASTWLATTGAAFSSAMGRMSLGSTNALLAAVNADLGIWLPNALLLQEKVKAHRRDQADDNSEGAAENRQPPTDSSQKDGPTPNPRTSKLPGDLTDTELFPRPRFSYLIKEILGWYSIDDRFVFITDGGHWDNLGLVELLRRDCDIIYCIDASADLPGSFTTLRQALALASLELDGIAEHSVDIDHYLKAMLPTIHYPPSTIAANLLVPRTGREPVKVRYTKLQATQDMDKELRRFAIADPKFPMYSTLRQFLSPAQFKNLIRIGEFAGRKMVALDDDVTA